MPSESPLRVAAVRLLSAPALVLLAMPAVAGAQVLNVPRRAAEATQPPPRDTRTTTTASLTASAFGGYDDNISEDSEFGQAPGTPPRLTGAGGVGQFNIGLDYQRSRGRRRIGVSGTGSLNTYGGIDISPTQTAGAIFRFETGMGRRNTLALSEMVNYDSSYGLGALGVVADPVTAPGELPTSTSVEGLFEQRAWSTNSSISLGRDWSRRDTTFVGYSYDSRTFLGENGETGFGHHANAGYSRALSRTASLNATYTYSDSEYAGSFTAGPRRPVASHNIEAGVAFTKRVSPRRSLQLSIVGGASHTETVSTELLEPYSYWAPTASLDARLDLTRTWTLAGTYRRTTTGFEGLSRETFVSNVAGVSVGGHIGRRTRLVLSGGAAQGNVDASATGTGEYTTGTGAAQVDVAITQVLFAVVQYSYFHYRFSADTVLPPSFPRDFSRNVVRVGLSLALPLTRTPRVPGARP